MTTSSAPTRMVALDVDGTIIDLDGRLSERVRDSVAAVTAAGIHIVLSTGRSLFGTLPILDRLGLQHGYAVCSNGAVILRLDPDHPVGYEIVRAETFDPSTVLKLLRDHLPTALYAVEILGFGHRLTAPFPEGELSGEMEFVPFGELLGVPVTRVIVRSPNHTSQDFVDLVGRLGLHEVSYSVGWTAWLDLAPEGVSKASALETVRERLGVPVEHTLAIGDGRNDLEMFGWAARSVAMGQAASEVIEAADAVTAPVGKDGLALVLEALVGGL